MHRVTGDHASIAVFIGPHFSGPAIAALVCPSAECCKLLRQMDLEDFFTMTTTTDEAEPTSWTQLCCDMEPPDSFKPKVIEAHQELACLPGKAGEPFREVVRGLVQDQEAKQAK